MCIVPYTYEGDVRPLPETDHSSAFSIGGVLSFEADEVFFEELQENNKTRAITIRDVFIYCFEY